MPTDTDSLVDRERIASRIRAFLKASLPGLEDALDSMTPSTPLWEVIGSFNLMEVADFVEQAFDVEVAPIDFVPANFHSIERIADYVARRHGARA